MNRAAGCGGLNTGKDELQKDASRFDVAFSDVVMPGMNGVELGQENRRRHPELPVLPRLQPSARPKRQPRVRAAPG